MRLAVGLALAVCLVAPALALDRVKVALDWKPDAERGGYYEALAEGLYRKHGLDVELIAGGPGIDNQRLIAAGAVDFAIAANNFMPLNLVQAGAPVRAVAAIFQKSPQVLIAHPDDGIASLADLKGHRLMIAENALGTYWLWLKSRYDLSDSQVAIRGFDLAPWVATPGAVIQGYATSDPYVLDRAHVPARFFLLADAGMPGYAGLILARQETIDAKPAIVQAFVDATIEGWRDYLDRDPKPGLDLVKTLNDEATDALNAATLDQLRHLGIVEGGDAANGRIGIMTDAAWANFFTTMAGLGVYPKDADMHAAYTLRFVTPPAP